MQFSLFDICFGPTEYGFTFYTFHYQDRGIYPFFGCLYHTEERIIEVFVLFFGLAFQFEDYDGN